MITQSQRRFQVLAEDLLRAVEQCTDRNDARTVGMAANVAVRIAELARYEGAREDYLDEAHRLLSSNNYRPGRTAVESAETVRDLIRQHVQSAMEDQRAAARAELNNQS
ncbi:hypothetical protein [Saccharopolyspora sp. 6V]|uniref:hypothetical protein n=1 Tax=Saccharopolyspora sp. 6V TaxID=2877239 RepID=UPI001CD59C8E|nr:hypothetical protein [Saccharopolyspora sp. 6V]MCA1191647.1 hypothetical protein [Saccharopolyspora sp. 6V]